MTFTNIDDFHEEKTCTYKNETYSVRGKMSRTDKFFSI